MTTIEAKEKLDKVTVLLPKDTVIKLDFMAQKALMGSRGRVIQSIVDSLWDSQFDLKQVKDAVNTYQAQPAQAKQTQAVAAALLLGLIFPLANIMRRLDQYLGVDPQTANRGLGQGILPPSGAQQAQSTEKGS